MFVTCFSGEFILILRLLRNLFKYKWEYLADEYVLSSYDNNLTLFEALKHSQKFKNLNPDELYSKCYFDDPPLILRLRKIKNNINQ